MYDSDFGLEGIVPGAAAVIGYATSQTGGSESDVVQAVGGQAGGVDALATALHMPQTGDSLLILGLFSVFCLVALIMMLLAFRFGSHKLKYTPVPYQGSEDSRVFIYTPRPEAMLNEAPSLQDREA